MGATGVRVKEMCVKFCVEFSSAQDTERDDVEPEEQGHASTERAVDLGVISESGDVPTEDERRDKPHGGGDGSTGKYALPRLLHGSPHVVDKPSDADASSEGDDPADEEREDVHRRASRGDDVLREPHREEMTEDNEHGGEGKGDQRERDEEKGATTALPESPAVDGKLIGTADALHECAEHAGGSYQADQKRQDERAT